MSVSKIPSTQPLWKRLLLRRLKFLAIIAVFLIVVVGGSYLFAPQWLIKANVMREAMNAKLDTKTVLVGDTKWVYYEGGEGPTMVLLHGFGARKETWLDLAPLLTAHFHVIIPDLPGWGESSRAPGESYNIDAQAARFNDFAQVLNLQHFMLIGHSMGGAIAGVYAAEHPDNVSSLVLIDSFGLKFKENDFSREAMTTDPFVYNDRAGFERATALAFAKPLDLPGRFVDVFVADNIRNHAFMDSTLASLRDPSQVLAVQNRLDKLTMPVLGLWCRDDKIIDSSALDSLRNGLVHSPGISASVLIGCNHMPIIEKPKETAQILTNFALGH